MNEEARLLKMIGTKFVNVTGLSNKNNLSTANDIAILSCEAQ